MSDIEFNKMNRILTKMKNDKMKANKRGKIKKGFDYAIAEAGGLDKLIDNWIDNKNNNVDKNLLELNLLSHYYKLTSRQQDKIDAQITAAELAEEYDGDISEYI